MLARLNDHRAWANRLYGSWLASLAARAPVPAATPVVVPAEIPAVVPAAAGNVPPGYALKMFSHVLRAEEAWLTRLRGGVPENKVWNVSSLGELEVLRVANDAGMREVLAGGAAALGRTLRYSRFDGTPMESTVADIVTHVCLHGMHHRGQIAAYASREGLEKAPVTDFIAFAREFP